MGKPYNIFCFYCNPYSAIQNNQPQQRIKKKIHRNIYEVDKVGTVILLQNQVKMVICYNYYYTWNSKQLAGWALKHIVHLRFLMREIIFLNRVATKMLQFKKKICILNFTTQVWSGRTFDSYLRSFRERIGWLITIEILPLLFACFFFLIPAHCCALTRQELNWILSWQKKMLQLLND